MIRLDTNRQFHPVTHTAPAAMCVAGCAGMVSLQAVMPWLAPAQVQDYSVFYQAAYDAARRQVIREHRRNYPSDPSLN